MPTHEELTSDLDRWENEGGALRARKEDAKTDVSSSQPPQQASANQSGSGRATPHTGRRSGARTEGTYDEIL